MRAVAVILEAEVIVDLKQRLLLDLYGREGVDEMRAVKRALDPDGKLAPGVLFAALD